MDLVTFFFCSSLKLERSIKAACKRVLSAALALLSH
jgi:hypothetical protein